MAVLHIKTTRNLSMEDKIWANAGFQKMPNFYKLFTKLKYFRRNDDKNTLILHDIFVM